MLLAPDYRGGVFPSVKSCRAGVCPDPEIPGADGIFVQSLPVVSVAILVGYAVTGSMGDPDIVEPPL